MVEAPRDKSTAVAQGGGGADGYHGGVQGAGLIPMFDLSAAVLLPHLILVVLTAIPAWFLFGRVGFSRWWTLLSLLPLGMIVILWLLVLRRWPRNSN